MDENKWDWLEKPEASECLEWVEAENISSTEKIDSLPNIQGFQGRLKSLVEENSPFPHFWIATHFFRFVKSAANKQGILEFAPKTEDGTAGGWRKVIDVGELSQAEGKNYEFSQWDFPGCVSPDGSRVMIKLSEGGSDLIQIRELDVEGGGLVSDGFRSEAGRMSVVWLDMNNLLISHTLYDAPKAKSGWPVASYIWARNTHLRDAKMVYSGLTSDALQGVVPFGSGETGQGMVIRAVDYSTITYVLVSLDGTAEELPLPPTIGLYSPQTTRKHIIVSLLKDTTVAGKSVPEGTVVAYNVSPGVPTDERTSIVYIPQEGEVNQHIGADGLVAGYDRVYMTITRRGTDRRLSFEYQGSSWRVVNDVPSPLGVVAILMGADRASETTLLRESGLLHPTKLWIQGGRLESTLLYDQAPAFDHTAFKIQLGEATSKDGTQIDYLTLSPKQTEFESGEGRVLMTGYGAYGISIRLNYLDDSLGGVSIVPWLEHGGLLVVPFIRGGGERGESWHQAARQEKRQNSYDDFIAVAERLVEHGITKPGRIGVFGTSNGGLLAAVVATQRPDLFGAAVSDVPLTDMLRFHLLAMGDNWIYEYGDPRDPAMAVVLRSYSPFHNVQEGTKYPPFLVTVSTKDDRVGPGHARKLVARLKEVGSPAYLLENRDGGHYVSDPLKNNVLMGRRMTFLLDTLS
jgi:prolyl oligopeptidase